MEDSKQNANISDAESEELDNAEQVEDRNKVRYGNVIDDKSYSTGTIFRALVIILGILIVPIELLCQGVVSDAEQTLILNL